MAAEVAASVNPAILLPEALDPASFDVLSAFKAIVDPKGLPKRPTRFS